MTNYSLTIGVLTASDDIERCFRIRANGNRPRPIVIKLSSSEARNKWLVGKQSRGALNGDTGLVFWHSQGKREADGAAAARATLAEARRAVGNGQLQQACVRDGSVLVRRVTDVLPVRLRRWDHLHSLISDPPLPAPVPSASSGVAQGDSRSSGAAVALVSLL